MSQLEEVNPDDNSSNDLLRCNSMDQVTEQRLDQPADSREELGIDQGQGSQVPAPTQLLTSQHLGQTLTTSTGDSDSQRNIGENGEEEWRVNKRRIDRKYRPRKKDKKNAREDENDRLKQENDEQKQRMKSVHEENEKLKWKLEEKDCQRNYLLDRIVGESMPTTYMLQLLTEVKLAISSLNQKVDGLQQNITQLSGTQVYERPRRPQHSIFISQGSRAAATTMPLTQPSGTSRMQQTFQSPGTFTEDSHGLPDFLPQQQLGQPAHPIDVSPEFSLHQGQGGSSAIEPQPFTDGLSDQYQFSSENFDFNFPSSSRRVNYCFIPEREIWKREKALGRNLAKSTEQTIPEALEAENGRLKHEIEENERLMKSNMEAFEAKNGKLKLEIGEKEQPMKSNLESFEAENERLKREIEQKKQLMKSNRKAFETRDGKRKHEIQEKQQLVKPNLETFEAQIRQLVDEFKFLNV